MGSSKVARYLLGTLAKAGDSPDLVVSEVNGDAAAARRAAVERARARPRRVLVLEVSDGVITGIRIAATPDKLGFASARTLRLSHSAWPSDS
ncbi:putative RNA-binding protein with TRAM domain [Prauserella sediminis]|uniref:Putative RNA-binding protein with TRAM domain n=1 Tax=Prauserella sediminis TaxID=577680 RepID=A0A839XS11_9PSEU|nr:hypothetical protein [Prauserella sediminis]MBB3662766.1 putative RNA-binding protein with TRAM domain [Prauserella sediminis]